jgi:hypothetical protein
LAVSIHGQMPHVTFVINVILDVFGVHSVTPFLVALPGLLHPQGSTLSRRPIPMSTPAMQIGTSSDVPIYLSGALL